MPLNHETIKNRAPELEKRINEQFAYHSTLGRDNAEEDLHHPYRSFGRSEYLFRCSHCDITTTQLFLALSKVNPSFKLLDIGTGDAELINFVNQRFKHVTAVGLSARDIRRSAAVSDLQYILGNAETLISNPKIQSHGKFHCIVSRNTFMHLTDPLGALVQAYEQLEDDGILMIDHFLLPGLRKSIKHKLFAYLRNKGYHIDVKNDQFDGVDVLFIRKTKPHLELPISYVLNVDQELRYSADEELLLFENDNTTQVDEDKYMQAFFSATIPFAGSLMQQALDEFDGINKVDQFVSQLKEVRKALIEELNQTYAQGLKPSWYLLSKIAALGDFIARNVEEQKRILRSVHDDHGIELHSSDIESEIKINKIIAAISQIYMKSSQKQFYTKRSQQTLFLPEYSDLSESANNSSNSFSAVAVPMSVVTKSTP